MIRYCSRNLFYIEEMVGIHQLMACLGLDASRSLLYSPPYDYPLNLQLENGISAKFLAVQDAGASCLSPKPNVPEPPLLPNASYGRTNFFNQIKGYSFVCSNTKHAWERFFYDRYEADVHVITDDKGIMFAHSRVLGITSPVLRNMLEQATVKGGFKCIRIPGVPLEAVRAFIHFLYSSCYELDEMKKYVLHLLVLSHTFSVPALKTVCVNQLVEMFLTAENVIDVLQLARLCDAPRLSLFCIRLVVKDFKTVSASEGWNVMKRASPNLVQELLEALLEADSRRWDRIKKKKDRIMYTQLDETMEAIMHIWKDGCRTIGPYDKTLKGSQSTCDFPACKVVEFLIRHFSNCKTRVSGGCVHCKCVWQLFELHSYMCRKPDSCKIPLCKSVRMRHRSTKVAMKWKLLARKVMEAKGTLSSIAAWRASLA